MSRTDRARFWAQHISRHRRSRLSRRAYCARHGLALSSFDYWRRKQRGDGGFSGPRTDARLVPVELLAEDSALARSSAQGASGIQLYSGAVRIELAVGFDVPTLRRALEALGC